MVAVIGDWQAADIVWSMWISSLATGYFLMYFAISHSMRARGGFLYRWSGLAADARYGEVLWHAMIALAIFSFHFLTVHFLQALMVQKIFPVPGYSGSDLSFWQVVLTTSTGYWPLVLVTLVLRWRAMHAAVTEIAPGAVIAYPYSFVLRNHLMIFVVGGAGLLGGGTWVLYGLLILYFFPIDIFGFTDEKSSVRH